MQNEVGANFIFSDEQIQNFAGLFYTLNKVHKRLIQEGYQITSDQILLPTQIKPP